MASGAGAASTANHKDGTVATTRASGPDVLQLLPWDAARMRAWASCPPCGAAVLVPPRFPTFIPFKVPLAPVYVVRVLQFARGVARCGRFLCVPTAGANQWCGLTMVGVAGMTKRTAEWRRLVVSKPNLKLGHLIKCTMSVHSAARCSLGLSSTQQAMVGTIIAVGACSLLVDHVCIQR